VRALLALALTVAGTVFVRLGRPGIWIDEAFTWIDGAQGTNNYNRCGYALIRWLVERLGGVPYEAYLRLLPAIAGWLVVLATAWAFRPLAGARRATFAALVVAASPWHLYWSQNARFYTFAELIALVAAGLLLRALTPPLEASHGGRLVRIPPLVYAVLGLVCAGVAALFQLSALLVLSAFAVAVLVLRPRLGLAPRAPSPARRLRGGTMSRRLGWAALVLVVVLAPAAFDVFEAYRRSKGGGSVGDALHALLALGFTIGPGLGAACLVGAFLAFRDRDRCGALAVAVPTLVGATVVALGLLTVTTAQYAFVALPWIGLVAAWPIGRGDHATSDGPLTGPRASGAWALLVVAPLLASSLLQLGPRYGDRPRWREALVYVESERALGDLVLCLPGPVAEFYMTLGAAVDGSRQARASELRPGRSSEHALNIDRDAPRAYGAAVRAGRPLWLIVRADYLQDFDLAERARFHRFLHDECRLEARFPVRVEARNLDLEVWRRD